MLNQISQLKETASQTAGPYVHIGLAPKAAGFDIFEKNFSNVLVSPETKGERIRIEGRVIDGSGTPLRDVLIEIWQANAAGRYNHPDDRQEKPLDESFRGWGRGCLIGFEERCRVRLETLEAALATEVVGLTLVIDVANWFSANNQKATAKCRNSRSYPDQGGTVATLTLPNPEPART